MNDEATSSGRVGRRIARRGFLAAASGAALAWPRTIDALERRWSGGTADDQDFWAMVRSSFLIPDDRIYLNNGTLGPPPLPVVEAVTEHARRVATTFPPGVGWDDLKGALAQLLGGDPEGFVVPRNTTEAVSFVASGLDWTSGDEVVITDHEHIGGKSAWEMIAARHDVELRRATLPVPAASSQELLEAVWREVGERTRLVCVSHVTFTNGTTLPISRLARRCREAGILLVADGAHPPGMLELDLHEVGADFYASSPHKWLLAPQGTGLLYLSGRWRQELWPTLVSGGWDDLPLGAHRLNHMGTMDESRMAGLLAAVEFHRALGPERVEARIRALHQRLRAALEGIPGLQIMSPAGAELSSGMLSFQIEGIDSLELQRHLARVANVRTRVIGEYALGWMRLSTHVYNTPAELDRVAELLHDVSRNGLTG